MWTWNANPFGTDAANPSPSGAGVFAFNLRFPAHGFDRHPRLQQNSVRDHDAVAGAKPVWGAP